MKESEQTNAIKEHLYNLTINFVRKYQPRYYKQYRGDLDDLISEFYCQFLTKKGRGEVKESLLDKYDPSMCPKELSEPTFFANLVKVSVQRMLIDRSRADSYPHRSMDELLEVYGDSIMRVFDLSCFDNSIDNLDIQELQSTLMSRISNMAPSKIQAIKSYYSEVRSVLTEPFRKVFDAVINPIVFIATTGGRLPMYQITPKTICLLYDKSVIDFDRFTGLARKNKPIFILESSLETIKNLGVYKYPSSREDFATEFSV